MTRDTSLGLCGLRKAMGSGGRYGGRVVLMIAVCLVGLAGVACSSKSPAAPASATSPVKPSPPTTVTVTVTSAGFTPGTVTTTVAANIIWVQTDAKPHTITSGAAGKADGKFDSGPLAKGASFTLVLHTAGTYSYFDKNTPALVGQVVIAAH